METTISEREEYIEREYNKWEERYVIPFESEFMVKSVLSLQHQFYTLPDEHIKSKADVLYSIQKIMRDLNLKPKKFNGNGETWIAELNYKNIDTRTFDIKLIKINNLNDKIAVNSNLNRFENSSFKELASILLSEIVKQPEFKKPSRILFEKIGVSLGLYESFSDLVRGRQDISMNKNGYLIYSNN